MGSEMCIRDRDSVLADDIKQGDAAVTLSTSTGAINITPASGSAVVLDGTVNVDAGVVTGATSVTSESFTATTGIDVSGSGGITLENDETITNSTDGTVLVTSPTTSLSGDLTVTGNDIVFGNGETITNAVNDTLTIGVAGASQVSFTDGTITPAADDDVDLGSSTSEFKNLYVDGVAYVDNIGFGLSLIHI